MKDRRYKGVRPVTDFSITQKIRTALIDAGHADLAIEQITQPISELEVAHGLLIERVTALEQEKVNWQTESGVYRAIESAQKKATGSWAIKAWKVVGGLAVAAAGAVVDRLITRTH
jgi:hypothetical protein